MWNYSRPFLVKIRISITFFLLSLVKIKIMMDFLMKQQKKLILFAAILTLISISAFSHNLKGIVTDKDGNPIPYATVFIKN